MSQPYVPSAFNLEPPVIQAIVDRTGFPTQDEQQFRSNLILVLRKISGIRVFIGGSDATAQVQAGINRAIAQGGGLVILPAGSFSMGAVAIPANAPPIWIMGQGPATKLTSNGTMPPGVGMFDVNSSNFWLTDMVLDGGRTVPVGMTYNVDFPSAIGPSDPMSPSLTNGTTVWVHGRGTGLSNFRFERLTFQHAAGYSLLLDALNGDLSGIDVVDCHSMNNRPTLFGTAGNPLIFGSWNGGFFAKGDGRAASGMQSGVVKNFLVQGCQFQRNNGNCLWSHNYGFERFNENFRYIGNQFLDCGLDGILVDVVSGGCVEGNIFRRIGYTTLTDTDQSTPRWLPGLNATAIDSGVVIGVNYVGNSMTSVNGGFVDLDGHGHSSLVGNVCRIPTLGTNEYIEDQIAITGPTNSGNTSYGFNGGNTYLFAQGMENINISGNTFINLPSGSIRLYSGRFCKIIGNIFDVPNDSTFAPIQMGPQSLDPSQRCKDNVISHNSFRYSPAVPAPCVKEDSSNAAFDPADINSVFGNNPIITSTAPIEFEPDAGSGSPTYGMDVWFP